MAKNSPLKHKCVYINKVDKCSDRSVGRTPDVMKEDRPTNQPTTDGHEGL